MLATPVDLTARGSTSGMAPLDGANYMQASADKHGSAGARIVLAEADGERRLSFAESLRRGGHIVWEAADGAQAVNLVRTHAPELLLVGIWLPVLNGLEVLEQLAAIPAAAGLKVVVLSPLADADTQLEGLALGVEDHWTTDIPVDDLCKRVDELIRAARTSPLHSD